MPESVAVTYAERAAHAFQAMQAHLLVPDLDLYRESWPTSTSGKPYAYVWPFEEAAKATLYMAGLPAAGEQYSAAVAACWRGRERYWDAHGRHCLSGRPSYASFVVPPHGLGGDTFYDDNTWCALDLVMEYRMFGDRAALDRAATVFQFVVGGWSRDRRPHPGGLFWVDARWNRDRGAATSFGAVALALQLHALTSPPTMELLDHAHRIYEWARATLLVGSGPLAGLYHDKVLGDGQVDSTQWVYNQGTAVAAGVMLHRVTRDAAYLGHAHATAKATLAFYGADGFMSQPAIFVAIFFRNLLQLDAIDGRPGYQLAMQAYADRVWGDPSLHDQRTGLFRLDRSSEAYTLLDQAAMVQLFALLAWPRTGYGLLA